MTKIAGSGSWIRIQIHQSEAWIRGSGSGSTPKCHESGTLVAGSIVVTPRTCKVSATARHQAICLARAIQPTSQCSSCVFMQVHVTHALGGAMSPAQMQIFQLAISKLIKWLFSGVLASHARGPCSTLGRDMLVLGPLQQFSMEITWVKSLHMIFNVFCEFFFFTVQYPTLHNLPPLGLHCVGGCQDRTQDCCDFGIDSKRLNHLVVSHPQLGYISSTNWLPRYISSTKLYLIHL